MEHARAIAEDWISAWNRRDLDAIMTHYAEDIEFYSPLIVARLGIASGRLDGKAALREYFAGGLESLPNLHFELVEVLAGVDSLVIYYRRETGALVAELTVVDAAGQALMVRAHYSR